MDALGQLIGFLLLLKILLPGTSVCRWLWHSHIQKPELSPTRMIFTILIKDAVVWNVQKWITENRKALDNTFFPAKNDYSLAAEWVHLLCGKGVRFLNNKVRVIQLFGKKVGAGHELRENGFIKTQHQKARPFIEYLHIVVIIVIITWNTLSYFFHI